MMKALWSNLLIVAAGRGRSMCLKPIVDTVVGLVPKEVREQEMCLVYLGTATYDKDDAFQAQTKAYSELPNCKVIKLEVSEAVDTIPSETVIRATIEQAHIILVSGGNTLYAMGRWKDLKIDQMIREAVATKGPGPVLCGGSAGAICWFDYGHSDSMDPTTFLHVDPNLTEEQKKSWQYIRVEGLGFIPALCVPHHDATQSNGLPRSQDSDAMLLKYAEQPSIGIDETAALVVTNGMARVVSADGKATCCFKIVEGSGRIQAKTISHEHDPIPLDVLLQG